MLKSKALVPPDWRKTRTGKDIGKVIIKKELNRRYKLKLS